MSVLLASCSNDSNPVGVHVRTFRHSNSCFYVHCSPAKFDELDQADQCANVLRRCAVKETYVHAAELGEACDSLAEELFDSEFVI